MTDAPVLGMDRLTVAMGQPGQRVRVVEELSLQVMPRQIVCVVGESGSGKSVSALALMRLLPPGQHEVSAEALTFEGRNLLALDERAMSRLRGNRMAMVFQEPMTSLNPVMSVGTQISEALRTHRGMGRADARHHALEALRQVQVPAPEQRLDAYPHQLSGGLRQRVMIAMALVCQPALLIADEPTTALDVTTQAQILVLLARLRDETGVAILFITHNLGVVAEIADQVAVMYAGRMVERGPAAALFRDAQHPYTLALLAAMPSVDGALSRLEPIPGRMPAPGSAQPGCRFAPRCPFALETCRVQPPLREMGPGHHVACWRAPVEMLA